MNPPGVQPPDARPGRVANVAWIGDPRAAGFHGPRRGCPPDAPPRWPAYRRREMTSTAPSGLRPEILEALEEPVRRYFAHAVAAGGPLTPRVRLDLTGRIRVGAWLRFASVWEGDGRSFWW